MAMTQEQFDKFVADNSLTVTEFNFRKQKVFDSRGEPVLVEVTDKKGNKSTIQKEWSRPDFKAGLPFLNKDSLMVKLTDSTITDEDRGKILSKLADYYNDVVYSTAQAQINQTIKAKGALAIDYQLSQSDINLEELDFWTIINREPVDRKLFSDELVAKAQVDFITVGKEVFKRADGSPVPDKNIEASAIEIMVNKFSKTKGDKNTLPVFKKYLNLWGAETQSSEFEEFHKYLLDKIEIYLNKEESSKIGQFE